MHLRFLLFFVANFVFASSFSQDFKSLGEVRQILQLDLAKLDDTLAQKGFIFDKTEGLVFKYKRITSNIAIQTSPKEITYSFFDRKFFLKVNSDLTSEGFQLINAEEDVVVHNQFVKASHFKKGNEDLYLWSTIDETTKKTVYSIKMQQNTVAPKSAPVAQPANPKPEKVESPTPLLFSAFAVKPAKQKETVVIPHDSLRVYPKPYRVHVTFAQFRFIDPLYGSNLGTNVQFGIQKSNYLRKVRKFSGLSDIGYEIDFSMFMGMDYEDTRLTKYYLGYNLYAAYDIKFADLVIEGGTFLNYNYGVSEDCSAGFFTSGIHFGEHIRRGFGKTDKGYSKRFIGFGFDQYIAFKGGYIGSVGVSLGF
jgi:hypothetical protein